MTYTPKTGFVGADTFTYQANDGQSLSNVATVTVTVVNRPPVAVNDTASTNQGKAVAIGVLANDTDPDGDPLSVTNLTVPANGTATVANGIVTYTPKSAFVGTDTFTYQASDGSAASNVATVTIQVNATTNTPPVAANDTASTNKNSAVSIPVLANDTDANGDVLSVANLTQPASGSTVVLNANGTVTYTPKAGFAGTDTFTYKASDGTAQSNVATVTVQVINRAPVAINDTASAAKNTAVTISVLANDSDPDGDPLTVTGLTQPANGTLTLNANGTVTYTPKKGFTGTDSLTYKASDGSLLSSATTVTISVK